MNKHRRPLLPTKHLTIGFAIGRIRTILKNPMFWFLTVLANGSILAGAMALFVLEYGTNSSITCFLDSVWWSVSTITTVGYGDIIPETPAGKIVGMFLMLFGTAIFSAFTALFAAILLEPEIADVEEVVQELSDKI